MTKAEKYHYADFTEDNYRRLLRLAKERYRFISYAQHNEAGHNLLWRHDVDYSLHRSLALARIEQEEGVSSTYFIYPHCHFYNLFDIEVTNCAKEIVALGHNIGLHADFGYVNGSFSTPQERLAFITNEKTMIETILGCRLEALSFHQPELRDMLSITDSTYAGMINTYSQAIFDRYAYCSDSNGHWRHRRLEEVLRDESINNLQVLTHPAWWAPTPMPPAHRIMRCVEGRAAATWQRYCDELADSNRQNENFGAEDFEGKYD